MKRLLVTLLGFTLMSVFAQAAQNEKTDQPPSRWRVEAESSPFGKIPPGVDLFNNKLDFSGQMARVNIVRGKSAASTWGFSLVGAMTDFTLDDTHQHLGGAGTSAREGDVWSGKPHMIGGEFRKSFPLVNFSRRVSLGFQTGFGAGMAMGMLDRTRFNIGLVNSTLTSPVIQGKTVTSQVTVSSQLDKLVGVSVVPIVELKPMLYIAATRHLSIKLGGGLDLPIGLAPTVGIAYSFGR